MKLKRGRGRPKGSKNKPKTEIDKVEDKVETTPKRRGRPKGSKNKVKLDKVKDTQDTTPKKRGRPKGSKNKVKKVKKIETKAHQTNKRGRGRPKGSKNKPKDNQETKAKVTPEFLQAGKIVYAGGGGELTPFPDVSTYKQTKRQEGLVDAWLLENVLDVGKTSNSALMRKFRILDISKATDTDRKELNEFLFGKDETYLTAKKKRGRIKPVQEKPKAKKTPEITEEDKADTSETSEVNEAPKRKRGRPRKTPEPVVEEGEVIISEVKSSKFLGYCPGGCDALLSDSNKVSDRKVECYSCGGRIWIKDLLEESSKEKPKTEKEWYEGSVSLDFCTDIRPITSSKPVLNEEKAEDSDILDEEKDD